MGEKKYIYTFAEALEAMKCGEAVKRIGWLGYWMIEPNNPCVNGYGDVVEIVMHCKDGSVVHMNSGCDSITTAMNMAENDWMILTEEQKAEHDKIIASRCLVPSKFDPTMPF